MRISWFLCVLAATVLACSSTDDAGTQGPADSADTSLEDTTVPDAGQADGVTEADGAPSDSAGPGDTVEADGSPEDTATGDSAEDTAEVADVKPEDGGGDAPLALDTGPPDDAGEDSGDEEDTESVDDGPPPVGAADWYNVFGSPGAEEVKGVAADSEGNVYVVGTYREPVTVGDQTFEPAQPGSTNPDSFIVSFDAAGGFRWAHSFGGEGADSPFEVDVDGQDRVFVAGSHQGDLNVGPDTLICNGSADVYVVAYDADGAQLWAKNWGGEYGETPRDLSVNESGDIFITGAFTGSIVADGVVATTPYELGGLSEIFVLAVDGETKNAMWIKTFTGYGHDVGTGLVADQGRNAVIAISYQQNLDVDTNQGLTFDSGGDNFNAGLVRLDDQGNVLWANEYGGPGGEEIIGLDMDAAGNIYATGVFSDTASFGGDDLVSAGGHDIILAGYTGAGVHLWSRGFTGGGFDQAQDLEVAGDGIYITGRFNEDLTLGDISLNTTNYDVLVARFDTEDGAPVWVETVGSDEPDLGNGVGIGGDGGVFVGGHMKGDVTFGGVTTSAMGGNIDAFVLRFSEEPGPTP